MGGSLFAVLMLAWGTATAVGALAHETTHLRRVISSPVQTIEVDGGTRGSITVLGASGDDSEVTIDMTLNRGLETPSHSETVEGDRLVLRSHCFPLVNIFCQVDYVIRVPEGVSVIAHTDGGDITISNVHGDLDLSSCGGTVEIRDVEARRVLLHSDGGDVRAEGLSAVSIDASSSGGSVLLSLSSPPTTVDVSSSGGDIDIELPDTMDAYHVNVSANGGGTSTEIRTDPTSRRVITAEANGGDVVVRYRAG
ncbi:MAG: DUF4097 family beta strand repeat-containing protein [Actinomycetota bacterium]